MSSTRVEHYVKRGVDFFEGMTLMRADPLYQQSSALLAIHSAISFADALRTGLGERKLTQDDHAKTVSQLRRLLSSTIVTKQDGLNHLQYLLSMKTEVAYGGKRIERTDYEALLTKAERFEVWARNIAAQLKIQGWRYDE